MRRRSILLVLVLLFAGPAAGQSRPDFLDPNLPTDGTTDGPGYQDREVTLLLEMEGHWLGTYRMVPGSFSRGGEGRLKARTRSGPGGTSVLTDLNVISGPLAGLQSHQVLKWNPDQDIYQISWVDSRSAELVLAEGEARGETIVYRREDQRNGKTLRYRGVITFETDQTYKVAVFLSVDGAAEEPVVEQFFRRGR